MISLKKIKFQYRASDFSLSIGELNVARQEKVAIIGPSGTGKTTLLNLMAGILLPAQGDIRVGKDTVSGMSDRQRRAFRIANIGFVFQSFELIDYLDVLDNILHPCRISSVLTLDNDSRARAMQLASDMGIGDKLHSMPSKLSQGEKQRVAICRAMLTRPGLILADEATGNLDPENKDRILNLLFKAVDEHESTLVAVTHDHDLLPHFDRVIDFQEYRKSDA
jgi:ABC-type lipoprotein export system ATPase subunit